MLFNLFILIFIYLLLVLIFSHIRHDTSVSNFAWGIGVMLVAIYTLFVTHNYLTRPILITTLISIWAVRMIIYLYIRYTGHDKRFENWKLQSDGAVLFNLLWILFGQFLLLLIMSIPAYVVNTDINQGILNYLDLIGILIWTIGFSFESVSDYQLFVFLKNPNNKGKVLQSGFWHYSRHPNYFGESLLWLGIFFIALNVKYGFLAIISWLTITILVRFVTGVPLLESAMKDNNEYQEYKKRTNIFVPWFN